ncbi:kelch repeat-containing protein [Ottowia thiooxydans]|uniref:kelch repeat-containing protein n=1 Tax=Ottowia thiooxydans TaxID=219182 RepID=UPI00146A22F8|nr:kelch repeat-containing protein [Ottowia thiooxydans]
MTVVPKSCLTLAALISSLLIATSTAHAQWENAAPLPEARAQHTATVLANGQVLVAGGSAHLANTPTHATTLLYNPATGQWRAGPDLAQARRGHTATPLPNGTVLIVGGITSSGGQIPLAQSGVIFDPRAGAPGIGGFTETANTPMLRRARHTATVLPNGQVLVVGGQGIAGQAALASTELYDPATRTWGSAPSLPGSSFGKRDHTTTLLRDGRVLVVGGESNHEVPTLDAYLRESDGSWTSVPLPAGHHRTLHSATLLPDGRVFVAGGVDINGESLPTSHFFHPATSNWTPGPLLITARGRHSATLLPDGRVLLAGGRGAGGAAIGTAEVLSPDGNAMAPAPTTLALQARHSHHALLLPNGQVLITGGADSTGTALGSSQHYAPQPQPAVTNAGGLAGASWRLSTVLADGSVLVTGGTRPAPGVGPMPAQRYYPTTNTWTSAGEPFMNGRIDGAQTLLADGRVLLTGGQPGSVGNGVYEADLYNPVTGTWSRAATGPQRRWGHTATLLPGGNVLVAGGRTSGRLADIYRPASNDWVPTTALSGWRSRHSATLLADGRVMVAGGRGGDGVTTLSSVEIYDPATATWQPGPGPLAGPRSGHSATLLPSGQVLITGGGGDNHLYDPGTGTTQMLTGGTRRGNGSSQHSATLLPTGQVMLVGGRDTNTYAYVNIITLCKPAALVCADVGTTPSAIEDHTAALLPDGRVLVAGGYSVAPAATSTWLVDPRPTIAANRVRPAITGGPATVEAGAPLALTGAAFIDETEAASGSTAQATSQVPILTVQRMDGGSVHWLLPSTGAVATVSTFTSVPLPASLPAGQYQARVYTGGMVSTPYAFNITNFLPPGAPTEASAQPGNSQATITWQEPTGTPAVASYTVTDNTRGHSCTAAAPASTCTIQGLTNGTPYTFIVIATSAGGATATSAPTAPVTPNGPVTPVLGAPTSVVGTAGNSRIALRWQAPAQQPGSVAPTHYTVVSSPSQLGCGLVQAPATTCTVTGLNNGTAYTFVVRAHAAELTRDSLPSAPVTPLAAGPGPDPEPTGLVPVPALGAPAIALLGLGAAALGALRLRRKTKQPASNESTPVN